MDKINITEGINTLILAPLEKTKKSRKSKQTNILPKYTSIQDLVKALKKLIYVEDPDRIQILLQISHEFIPDIINEINDLYNLSLKNRDIYTLSLDTLKLFTCEMGFTKIPKIDHAVELLNKCYNSIRFNNKLNKNASMYKFSKDKICTKLNKILDMY